MSKYPRLNPGDNWQPRADTVNAMLAAAAAHDIGLAGGRPFPTPTGGSALVHIQNNSGGDIDRFELLGINGLVYQQSDNADGFYNAPLLAGVTCNSGNHWDRHAVAQEPIASGAIGLAMLTGVTVMQVNIQRASDRFAGLNSSGNVMANMYSWPFGSHRIVAQPSGTGTKWCLVNLHAADQWTFDAQITGNAALAGASNRWKYAWKHVERNDDAWQDVTSGLTGSTTTNYALNRIEAKNTGSGVEGHGVDVTTKTSGGNYPDGFAVKPIATGAIVTMRAHYDASDQGSGPLLRYTFEAINTDDGPCEAA